MREITAPYISLIFWENNKKRADRYIQKPHTLCIVCTFENWFSERFTHPNEVDCQVIIDSPRVSIENIFQLTANDTRLRNNP